MSMFASFSDAVQSVFNTVTTTANSVQKGLDVINDQVDNFHKTTTRNAAKQAILNTSEAHRRIQDKLEADPKLAVLFAQLEAEWDLPRSEWATLPLPTKSPNAKKK